jgi:pimeloyl-ACP methyl ester carboxylesterase
MFFGLPSRDDEAMAQALTLELPVLVMVDPDDPVTRATYSRQLASHNANAQLWVAPPVPANHPELLRRGEWGSHVMAFIVSPNEVVARILEFMQQARARKEFG